MYVRQKGWKRRRRESKERTLIDSHCWDIKQKILLLLLFLGKEKKVLNGLLTKGRKRGKKTFFGPFLRVTSAPFIHEYFLSYPNGRPESFESSTDFYVSRRKKVI